MTTTAGHSFYKGPIVFFYYQVNDTGSWEPLVIHIEHICSFFVAFFSATIDGRNLIFGHKLHPISFLDPSDSYFLFAVERGYHKWALAHVHLVLLCLLFALRCTLHLQFHFWKFIPRIIGNCWQSFIWCQCFIRDHTCKYAIWQESQFTRFVIVQIRFWTHIFF